MGVREFERGGVGGGESYAWADEDKGDLNIAVDQELLLVWPLELFRERLNVRDESGFVVGRGGAASD
jgi:hypothetical protein